MLERAGSGDEIANATQAERWHIVVNGFAGTGRNHVRLVPDAYVATVAR